MEFFRSKSNRFAIIAAILVSIAIFAIIFSFMYTAALRNKINDQNVKINELQVQVDNLDLSVDEQGEEIMEENDIVSNPTTTPTTTEL